MPSIIHNLQLLNNQGIRKMAAFEFAVLDEDELFLFEIIKYVISYPFLIFIIIQLYGFFVNF